MQNAKDAARQLIDQLPDTATFNDIMYELYVKQKIERGLQDSREGKTTPHEEVRKRYQQRADNR
jgi:predicted transcriptional regulator